LVLIAQAHLKTIKMPFVYSSAFVYLRIPPFDPADAIGDLVDVRGWLHIGDHIQNSSRQ